jgi:hypothetical protein
MLSAQTHLQHIGFAFSFSGILAVKSQNQRAAPTRQQKDTPVKITPSYAYITRSYWNRKNAVP